jgi:hypothetical protein
VLAPEPDRLSLTPPPPTPPHKGEEGCPRFMSQSLRIRRV